MLLAESGNGLANFIGAVLKGEGNLANAIGDNDHILFIKTAGGDSGCADTDTAGDKRAGGFDRSFQL